MEITDETAVEINTGVNVDPDINYEIDNWGDLDLDTPLLRGIYGYGFETPSPIQKKAIKPIILGRDVIAQAQSGTGKTATFAIAALSKVDLSNNNTQILILSPTKELSLQSAKVIEGLGNMINGLRIQTCYGGSSQENGNRFSTKNNPHIICGCTGRVFDMMRRNKLSAEHIKLVILDEADEMLSSGFIDQVYNIFRYFNDDIQVVLVSATVTDTMNSVISKIMRNPVTISVKREMLTLEGIKQYYVAVDDDRQKFLTLKDIFVNLSVSQCIIYCNSIVRVQDLYDAMKNDDYPVCQMHGNMTKEEREKSFNEFKTGGSRFLISTNLTARGIDVQQVSVVINFDLPKCVNTYLHRIGRSGRWGRKGTGINFITRYDVINMKNIESHYSTQIGELPANLEFLTGGV